MVLLGYLDAHRLPWLLANFVQVYCDYFGVGTHERIDAKGAFPTE